MKRISWRLVFLGGFLAGIVLVVLGYGARAIYLDELWNDAMEALGHQVHESIGLHIFWIVCYFAGRIGQSFARFPIESIRRAQKCLPAAFR